MGQRLARHGVVAASQGGHMEAAPSRTAMLAAVARGLRSNHQPGRPPLGLRLRPPLAASREGSI